MRRANVHELDAPENNGVTKVRNWGPVRWWERVFAIGRTGPYGLFAALLADLDIEALDLLVER